MKKWLSILIVILLLVGCSKATKVGPSVSMEQAEKVATDYYHMVKILKSDIKHISEDFVNQNENPVYFVIEGINKDGRSLIVFVESNNASKHFVKYID
ncbi:hypothetical protein ACHOLT_11610 [Desulfitobacterium sp. Sab5]|uniref:hypothetical protein n=1 Tax=Desulfitobacterium nosdiversum TaxID=3375356 RepID=UPI003CE69EBA